MSPRTCALVGISSHAVTASNPGIVYKSGEKYEFEGRAIEGNYQLIKQSVKQVVTNHLAPQRTLETVILDICDLLKTYGFKDVFVE